MKKLITVVVLLGLCTLTQATTFYLVRHAEKLDDGSKDPVLTLAGQARAKHLASMLANTDITAVYATDYQRTQLTAKPLADFLGITVTSYDPSYLPAFAEQLKQQGNNALVVGHSNTTPMLTFLLSGQATIGLDEADYDNIFQVSLSGDQARLTRLRSLPSNSSKELTQIQAVNARFFSGELTFNMLLNGQVVGQSVHGFSQSDDQYQLHEKTTIEQYNIHADIEVAVKQNNLAPVRMRMSGSMGTPVDIQLNWHHNQVSGHSEMAREPFKAQGKIDIAQTLRPHSLERTSAIMLAHMMPVSPGQPILINWFNGYDADNRLITISHEGEEQVTVPAGTFDTYKVKYSGGAPSQYYWIDKQHPKVVKIEVIKSPWSYELVSH